MALRGTLADLGIVDLIQFVHQARKVGALVVTVNGDEARLYYNKGNLVDARLGDQSGLDVLVQIVDWESGEFVFEEGVMSDDHTIEMDLHRAVMNAVKIRDERKFEEEMSKSQPALAPKDENEVLSQCLREAAANIGFLLHTCLLDNEGSLVAEASGTKTPEGDMERLRAQLHSFAKDYPRSEMKRVFMEDSAGTIALVAMPENRILVVLADREASLGVVSVGTGKIVARIAAGKSNSNA